MIIFTSKLPRVWRSSNVKLVSGKLEMEAVSFVEETFISEVESIRVDVFCKNIIGNGFLFLKVYEEKEVLMDIKIHANNVSCFKKTVSFTTKEGSSVKVYIYRDKRCSGKVLIDHVAVHLNKKEEIKEEIKEEPKEEIREEIKEEIREEPKDEIREEIKEEIREDPKEEIREEIKEEVKEEAVSTFQKVKKKRFAKIIIKKEFNKQEDLNKKEESAQEPIITSVEEAPPIKEPVPQEKVTANVTVIDLNIIKDERDVFKYKNQISFGKKQLFLIKQSTDFPQDFSKYSNVLMFDNEESIIEKLKCINVKKISFKQDVKDPLLLEFLKELKREI